MIKTILMRAVLPVVVGFAVGGTIEACASVLPTLDDPELADVAKKLSDCRTEARASVQTGDTNEQAYAVYQQCKHDAGLQ